jgi:uncharacterized protein (DUF2267 family)
MGRPLMHIKPRPARFMQSGDDMERVMSTTTGVTVLDHTVQETKVWLKGVEEEVGLDTRQQAYNATRAVLHALRDRLPPEVAIKLGAQLPILVRGIYYEGWHAAGTPTKERHVGEFVDHVEAELPQQFPANPLTVTQGVFEILWKNWIPVSLRK